MEFPSVFRTSIASVITLAACAAGAAADTIRDWNLVVRNHLNTTSEVSGSALVGGNVTGTSNYSIRQVTASNGAGLMVGGSISSGTNVQINNGGDLYYGGAINGIANMNGGGSRFNQSAASAVSSVFAQADAYSTFLSGLSSTGTVDSAGNMSFTSTTMVGSQRAAVFSMTQATLTGLGQLNLNFGSSADLIVINFDASGSAGAASFAAPPNFVGGLNESNSGRIVWNFLNTSTLTVNNNFNGMILAPDADLRLRGGGINGTVIVDNVSEMNAEVRLNLFQGDIVLVPLPSAAFAGLGLLGAIAGVRAIRRR